MRSMELPQMSTVKPKLEEVREMNKEIRKYSKSLKAGEDEEEKAE